MKTIIRLLILGGLFISGCEEGVVIQNQPFTCRPVIYCLIDPLDTVHSIRIERMFSGMQPPAITAANADSLFFKEIKVTVQFADYSDKPGDPIEAQPVEVNDKEPGYFGSQKHYLYRFVKVLGMDHYNFYKGVHLSVEVPGLPVATASCKLINSPRIYSPSAIQQFIYIVPESPLRIQWTGGSWNEVDITFEIKEMYSDSIATKTIQFQKVNDVFINGKYYEIRIPYDLIVQEIAKTLKFRRDIIKRYFGQVYIIIHTGQEEYANYIEFLGGINDFNQNPFSNIENGLGLLTSKSSIKRGPLLFDQASRFEFASDPILKKLSFIEY